MTSATIVWFRHDLRLSDNPALSAAMRRGGPVVPVFIWAPEEEGRWPPGAASRWWLHQSLASLDRSLRQAGSRLTIRRGPTLETLRSLANETGATAVFWNRRYEPAIIARDTKIKSGLQTDGRSAESFNGYVLFEPWTIKTQQGKPYKVFTPFWRACLSQPERETPESVSSKFLKPAKWPESIDLRDLGLEPAIDWAGGMREAWRPGEVGARQQWSRFLEQAIGDYADRRNRPDFVGTSRLSPHLHFGEISVREMWFELASLQTKSKSDAIRVFQSELGWREFAHHLLFHFPHTAEKPLREGFAKFPWRKDANENRAWQRGRTGYPMVDAGMRELWRTGWMHNRVRMIVASFLVKDLLISWQEGAAWFWDTLVDADLANNTLGWQWTAGCGADAAPYFRIFNPVSQGEKFDPDGAYMRRWVPELQHVPTRQLHKPWPTSDLEVGRDYPSPIVDHGTARQRALKAFSEIND
jgi:deoxyribodipyrimidine photo-lyase